MRLSIPDNLRPPARRGGAKAPLITKRSARTGEVSKSKRSALPEASNAVAPKQLVAVREGLAAKFVELQWDLGGMAYEMASRDHYRLDVLNRQAAKLQAVDAELAEAERMLRLDEAGAGGTCAACGALHARGAAFCWQCGHSLLTPVAAAHAATTVEVPVVGATSGNGAINGNGHGDSSPAPSGLPPKPAG